MREHWSRSTPELFFSLEEIETLFKPVFSNAKVTGASLASGGLRNTNVCVRLNGHSEPILLRLHQHEPGLAEKEMQINKLICDQVAVPRLYYFGENNSITHHPYTVMQWIDGSRLDSIVGQLDLRQLKILAYSLGETLASIHSFKFHSSGFFTNNLEILEDIDFGGDGLLSYANNCLVEDIGHQRLGAELTSRLIRFIEKEGKLLDEWTGAPCLMHADFGGSNILVKANADDWEVAAVLDWEFALSATPFADFGNLLRKPLGLLPGFEDSVFLGYTESGGILPDRWRRMSRLIDLGAWMDFARRPGAGQRLIADAKRTIVETIDTWNP